MKKIVAVMLIFMLLALGGCGEKKNVLEVTEFSQETQNVLQILQNRIYFFDYTVDESIKATAIELWGCTDGVWESSGKAYGNIEAGKRQIAVEIADTYVQVFELEGEGSYSSYKFDLLQEMMLDPNMATASTYCVNPAEIEPNKEIALWARWSENGESASGHSLNDFREGYCDKGLAVTVTFYDEPFTDGNGEESQSLNEVIEIEAQ